MTKFTAIMRTALPTDSILSACTDPNALHVLLWTPNLPNHYIVYDGLKYWMVCAVMNAWETRKEYKGQTPYLRCTSGHQACTLDLPFKIRYDLYMADKLWHMVNGKAEKVKQSYPIHNATESEQARLDHAEALCNAQTDEWCDTETHKIITAIFDKLGKVVPTEKIPANHLSSELGRFPNKSIEWIASNALLAYWYKTPRTSALIYLHSYASWIGIDWTFLVAEGITIQNSYGDLTQI